jgi:hypothetical protein
MKDALNIALKKDIQRIINNEMALSEIFYYSLFDMNSFEEEIHRDFIPYLKSVETYFFDKYFNDRYFKETIKILSKGNNPKYKIKKEFREKIASSDILTKTILYIYLKNKGENAELLPKNHRFDLKARGEILIEIKRISQLSEFYENKIIEKIKSLNFRNPKILIIYLIPILTNGLAKRLLENVLKKLKHYVKEYIEGELDRTDIKLEVLYIIIQKGEPIENVVNKILKSFSGL